jgi:hypothetical protein
MQSSRTVPWLRIANTLVLREQATVITALVMVLGVVGAQDTDAGFTWDVKHGSVRLTGS